MNTRNSPRRENTYAGRVGVMTSLHGYLMSHLQAFVYSLGQLWRAPLSMVMTAAVIGIALALPTGLNVLLNNAQQLSGQWGNAVQISLFLKGGVSPARAHELQKNLQRMPEISQVDFISPEQALEEFKRLSGFGDALKALDENPLPAVLVIQPSLATRDHVALENLLQRLRGLQDVDVAQLDENWLRRLSAIMSFVQRGLFLLSGMLALAVILVVGNTIRLAIQNRRDEIVVIKLIGGTDAFIRRPFLYTGLWYGLMGAGIAYLLIAIALFLLSGPVQELSSLYQSKFDLLAIDFRTLASLLVVSVLLGLGGSWLAVGRHLREIEPR